MRIVIAVLAAALLMSAPPGQAQQTATPPNDAQFAEIAKTYRDAAAKPALSEEAHKFQVQAELTAQARDFAGAADLYARGLIVAPWWPAGHFNRALILADLGKFDEARAEMARYLLLAPDAPDARAAQDKTYEWELQAAKTTKVKQAADEAIAGEMAVIPAGTFMMGAPPKQHAVTLKSFEIGKYAISEIQWRACVADGACVVNRIERTPKATLQGGASQALASDKNGYAAGFIGWDEAKSFLAWLNKKTGGAYRLATEAEWEYAVRGGTKTAYYWGDRYDSKMAANDQFKRMGSYPPNPYGLYDMLGNIGEWVEDCWHEDYTGAPTDGSAWAGADCARRVVRGGAGTTIFEVTNGVAHRFSGDPKPSMLGGFRGFRIARTSTP
jgi:formylglycine-generating enzyme required for sulfatase activity